jgi:hypothetical protein
MIIAPDSDRRKERSERAGVKKHKAMSYIPQIYKHTHGMWLPKRIAP